MTGAVDTLIMSKDVHFLVKAILNSLIKSFNISMLLKLWLYPLIIHGFLPDSEEMNFMVRPIRPGYLIFQNCVCQRIINSQRTVLSPVNIKVSCYKSRHFMGETHITNGNSLPQSSSLLQPKNVELTTLSDQNFSSSSENQSPTTDEVKTLSNKDKLKRAIKDYGATVIVFHITISLMSLGTSYLVISRWE